MCKFLALSIETKHNVGQAFDRPTVHLAGFRIRHWKGRLWKSRGCSIVFAVGRWLLLLSFRGNR